MSDFRMRSYAKNSTSPSASSSDKPTVKKAILPTFDEKQDKSGLYKENQENMLKNWIESRLLTKEELTAKITETTKLSPEDLDESTRRLLIEKDKVEGTGRYYQKSPESTDGFMREGDFSQLEKVAKFLMTLPKDQVAEIFKHLDMTEVESIVRQMVRISPSKNPVEVYELHQEFKRLADKTKKETKGGMGTARRILEKSMSKEQADKILHKVEKADHVPFDFLQNLDDKDIWDVIKGESSAVLAVIFNFLNRSQAKFVVNKISPEKQKDLFLRLGRMERVHAEILESLEGKIRQKVEERQLGTSDRVEGKEVLAQILQHMDPSAEEKLKGSLELEAQQKEELDDLLFSMDVILRMRDEDMHTVLKDYSAGELALLIRGKDLEIKHRILSNLSKRRQEDVEDEGYAIGRVHVKEVDLVTRRFLNDLKRRQDDAEITIFRKNEEFVQ